MTCLGNMLVQAHYSTAHAHTMDELANCQGRCWKAETTGKSMTQYIIDNRPSWLLSRPATRMTGQCQVCDEHCSAPVRAHPGAERDDGQCITQTLTIICFCTGIAKDMLHSNGTAHLIDDNTTTESTESGCSIWDGTH